MSYALGLKVLRKLCEAQDPLQWHHAKLSPPLFKAHEVEAFQWVDAHLKKHHALPQPETLFQKFPDTKDVPTPEPVSYYVQLLENAFFHSTINQANIDSQNVLKGDPSGHDAALAILQGAIKTITEQKYRQKIIDAGVDGSKLVLTEYHQVGQKDPLAIFGWPYLDQQTGGGMPGDVISYIGRPAAGKTWKMLWSAIQNWKMGRNVLFVSMEMSKLPILQRVAAVVAGTNITQMKMGQFSGHTYKKFLTGLQSMKAMTGKMYVVEGNLASTVTDIYMVADMLGCHNVYIDGAYLVKHENKKLDRFTRVAENVELMKQSSEDGSFCTFASWQFNREASKKTKQAGEQKGNLDDIGYSDAIGQVSSIALGLFQEDSVETIMRRTIKVLKGRNGEVGEFSINWDFQIMDFSQVDPPLDGEAADEAKELLWI